VRARYTVLRYATNAYRPNGLSGSLFASKLAQSLRDQTRVCRATPSELRSSRLVATFIVQNLDRNAFGQFLQVHNLASQPR
jgi:hypothetical protein